MFHIILSHSYQSCLNIYHTSLNIGQPSFTVFSFQENTTSSLIWRSSRTLCVHIWKPSALWLKVSGNVVHVLHNAVCSLMWRSFRMLCVHILPSAICLKSLSFPQSYNCTSATVVSSFLQDIFTVPDLYHLVLCIVVQYKSVICMLTLSVNCYMKYSLSFLV